MLCTKHSDTKLQDLGGGVSRRILAYTEKLMIVEVNFLAGSVGTVHTHPHSQNVYIISGKFKFDVNGQEIEVSAGDSLAFEPNLPHGTLCLEAGTLLDIFTPMREDFLK
ncbi:MAG: cupin domain-containing protein [Synergistaceae bacterium]|nr:cupin domain-containing protein [Synergistaceae bacterium]